MMKINRTINYMALLLATSLTACMNQDDVMQQENVAEQGSIEISFGAQTRSTTTTISPEEARGFLVTVSRAGEVFRGPQTLGSMNMRFPAGQGYTVYAESCTPADAESNNNYWGQKRFVGNSEEFGILKGETTKVRVPMSVDNAAMCVVINPSLANYFKQSCTITIQNTDRDIVWTYDNAGKVEDGVTTDGQIAFFNIDESNTNEDGQRIIEYSIVAVAQNKTIEKTGTLALSRAKMSRLNLAYQSGFFTLDVDVDYSELYIDNDLTVGPNDIIQDDGATDMNGGNDDFHQDGTEVDYDQYN